MSLLCPALLALTLSTGTVTLHVTDAHGKPVRDHEFLLIATNSTKSIRPFGYQWSIPSDPPVLKGKTDAKGVAKIGGVRRGSGLMVVTRFGPRFDPFVKASHPDYASPTMDVMKFEGAVFAGKPARVVLADDYELTGRVTEQGSGAPMSGVKVTLSDTGLGHMSGYPGTTIDETTTDAQGRYVFRRLPNCHFSVDAAPTGSLLSVEARPELEDWQPAMKVDEKGKVTESRSTSVLLKKANTVCDFQIARIATLTVVVRPGNGQTLHGWTATTVRHRGKELESTSGISLAWVPQGTKPKPKSEEVIENLLTPGTYSIVFTREKDGAAFTAQTMELRPGERRKLEFTLSDLVARKRKQ